MGYRRYTIDDWRAVRRALARGGTVRGVAEETGVGRGTVFQWARRDAPPGRVWATMVEEARGGGRAGGRVPGSRLTYEDRALVFAIKL